MACTVKELGARMCGPLANQSSILILSCVSIFSKRNRHSTTEMQKAAQSITKMWMHSICSRKYIVTTQDAHHKQSKAAIHHLFLQPGSFHLFVQTAVNT